ncbi:unnamed protein product [Ilex paraguariensis]|uniref:non-specific serine/threonine protein kinase n=1 Tax=Ilex paraguariensis TaxID=185542 RepID=A0ABC8TGS9_9AQUA
MLVKAKHFLFNNNQLRGNIPPTLGLVQTLVTVRLDWNSLSGPVPPNLNNLTSVKELYLSNNELTGPLPDFTGMNSLTYMVLSNNKLNGTLDIGNSYSNNLTVDLQNNSISDFTQKASYNMVLKLVGNPICQGNGATERYCTIQKSNPSYITPTNSCTAVVCRSDRILSPNCKCAYPYTGTLHFFSFSFSNLENSSYFRTLAESLMSAFQSNQLLVDSVSLSDPTVDVYSYLQFRLQIFPSALDHFNRTGISTVGFLLTNSFPIPNYGSYSFKEESYCCFAGAKKPSNTGINVGAVVGSFVLVLFILGAGFYAFHQKREAKRAVQQSNPFANWDRDESSGGVPQLKGARWFSFEELRKCTNNFAEVNVVGSGGYGKVYRGTIASDQLVAIKRARQGSLPDALQFKTEIELLSRIHHKNVVSLVGFCYEQGEQMLVYEYIPNGTLKDALSGKSGFQLNWMRRLRIALDSAKGLAYMHELANPPIIHRDIKSTNILLDDCLNAKVADFGLSKLMEDTSKNYVSTQVKGTMGYMDPEYYTTQQLSEKSDVYSFGIVLLELVTARAPIERGKYIVVVVKNAIANLTDQYYIHDILDPTLGPSAKLGGLKKFVELAMRCVKDSSSERPTMGEVVREIENIMQLASSNKNFETEFTSSSYEGSSDGSKAFDYSGGL